MATEPNNNQPEIDDETLIGLGKLAVALGRNPETGRAYRRLVKKVNPSYQFPADDVADLREELDERDRKRKEDEDHQRVLNAQAAERAAVANRRTPDQMTEIEAIMTKYGIASYEAADKIYAADLKPTAPARDNLTSGRTWDMPKSDGLFEDPNKWALNEAAKVIDEIRSGVLKAA